MLKAQEMWNRTVGPSHYWGLPEVWVAVKVLPYLVLMGTLGCIEVVVERPFLKEK